MEHFANFGVVKKANKQLKKMNEMRPMNKLDGGLGKTIARGGISYSELQEDLQNNQKYHRAGRKLQKDPLALKPTMQKVYADESSMLNHPYFTDVRKDPNGFSIGDSGYLGFRKDPFKGYGGMMEEPVPRYVQPVSRVSGKLVGNPIARE